jgi:hypothetical protein
MVLINICCSIILAHNHFSNFLFKPLSLFETEIFVAFMLFECKGKTEKRLTNTYSVKTSIQTCVVLRCTLFARIDDYFEEK